jgi:hypothetical protein
VAVFGILIGGQGPVNGRMKKKPLRKEINRPLDDLDDCDDKAKSKFLRDKSSNLSLIKGDQTNKHRTTSTTFDWNRNETDGASLLPFPIFD